MLRRNFEKKKKCRWTFSRCFEHSAHLESLWRSFKKFRWFSLSMKVGGCHNHIRAQMPCIRLWPLANQSRQETKFQWGSFLTIRQVTADSGEAEVPLTDQNFIGKMIILLQLFILQRSLSPQSHQQTDENLEIMEQSVVYCHRCHLGWKKNQDPMKLEWRTTNQRLKYNCKLQQYRMIAIPQA